MDHIKIGEFVGVDLGHAGRFGAAKIEAVKKGLNNRVYCDLSIKTDYNPEKFTKIENVDSVFIMSRQDWLDMHQKDYGKDEVQPTPTFETVTRPVIKWLCENHHPHVTVIITPTNAELLEGLKSTGQILDYVRD
jgi:hypothetical protein